MRKKRGIDNREWERRNGKKEDRYIVYKNEKEERDRKKRDSIKIEGGQWMWWEENEGVGRSEFWAKRKKKNENDSDEKNKNVLN
jgi:hypothetical protein